MLPLARATLLALLSLAFPASSARSQQPARPAFSFALGASGELTSSRITGYATTFTAQSLSAAPGVFFTMRETFKPWLGFAANLDYARPTNRTIEAPSRYTGGVNASDTPANMYAFDLTYVARKHLTNRTSLFAEAGGGVIGYAAIKPAGYASGHSNSFETSAILGFGLEHDLTHGLGLRAQYRALLTRFPYPAFSGSPHLNTVISQPTLSLTYTFGQARKSPRH